MLLVWSEDGGDSQLLEGNPYPFRNKCLSLHIKNGLMRVEENYKRETKNDQNMRQIPLPQ